MLEAITVVAIAMLLWAVEWATSVDPAAAFWLGAWLVAAGFAFGVPTGIVYHWALYRALHSVDALPRRWWLRPTALHDRIPGEDRTWVLGWCLAGALGFLVILIGIPLAATGAWRLL